LFSILQRVIVPVLYKLPAISIDVFQKEGIEQPEVTRIVDIECITLLKAREKNAPPSNKSTPDLDPQALDARVSGRSTASAHE
jgi:hypothetical protein